jgi:hypothetical protein
LYVTTTGFRPIIDTFRVSKLKPGLLRGLAIGGLLGFATLFLRLLQRQNGMVVAPVFLADRFWWEALLALLTSFWETLFFYSFIMVVIQDLFEEWPLSKQLTLVVTLFMLFHIPNTFLRFSLTDSYALLVLLTLFATGQGLLFARQHNAYLLIISYTIWGLSLLINF